MRRLPKPTEDAGEVYSTCVARVRSSALRSQLIALRGQVENAATDYDTQALIQQWYMIDASSEIDGVSQEELIKVYKNKMAKPGSPGRHIYDRLSIVPQNRCPLCGQRNVSTLDHYLPESQYSLLVVVPLNLVPCCKDCNFNKRATVPTSIRSQTIHPYYDDFDDAVWIEARLINVEPLAVLYSVRQPNTWDEDKVARARHHFETLKLGDLYSDHAVGELIEIKNSIAQLFDAGGGEAVRNNLNRTASSITEAYLNSWRGALYKAAASADWFCDGGFTSIA